jgi:Ca2+-binding EF-hand superfamily protein
MAMIKMFRSVVALAALLTVATPALADEPTGDLKARAAKRVDQAFAKLDVDHDGRISKDEAAQGPKMSKVFDRVDADHDGFVTRAELTASIERRMARRAQKQQSPAPQQ